MKKILSKVTAITLAFALAVGFGPVLKADAKTDKSDPVKKVKVTNADDFEDMDIGSKAKIETKIIFVNSASKSQKEAFKSLKYTSKNKKVATVSDSGVVKAVSQGTAKIVVAIKNNKSSKKTTLTVEVSSNYDMVFKYSNLYFVVPDETQFPVKIAKGAADAQNSTFDIKTLNFTGELSDFNYTSEDSDIADIKYDEVSKTFNLVLYKYGQTCIEAEYKKEAEVGDSINVFIMTQTEFDEAVKSGEIAPENENGFEEDPDEPDDPEDIDDESDGSDDSEDE